MVGLAFLLLLSLGLSGCVALPVIGAAAASGGAGGVVKAGVEYSFGGTALRTFSAPLDEVHVAALGTLQRLGVKVTEEERTADGSAVLFGEAYGRSVMVTLEPITPVMTRVGLGVRAGLSRDRATATEILLQTERAIEMGGPEMAPQTPPRSAAARETRAAPRPPGTAPAKPARTSNSR